LVLRLGAVHVFEEKLSHQGDRSRKTRIHKRTHISAYLHMKGDFQLPRLACQRGLAAILAACRQSGMEALPVDWQG
jgi:hypothetical protein